MKIHSKHDLCLFKRFNYSIQDPSGIDISNLDGLVDNRYTTWLLLYEKNGDYIEDNTDDFLKIRLNESTVIKRKCFGDCSDYEFKTVWIVRKTMMRSSEIVSLLTE